MTKEQVAAKCSVFIAKNVATSSLGPAKLTDGCTDAVTRDKLLAILDVMLASIEACKKTSVIPHTTSSNTKARDEILVTQRATSENITTCEKILALQHATSTNNTTRGKFLEI